MDSPTAPAASGQPTAAPVTVSAERAAANANDFASFDKAHTAARSGAPLERVAVDPKAAAAPASGQDVAAPSDAAGRPTSQPSEKDRKADERLRQQVAHAVAEKDAEIARLRAQLPAQPAAPAEPPAKSEPAYKRYLALPDAPKLTDFDSVEEHAAAMAYFITDKTREEQATVDRSKQERQQFWDGEKTRVERVSAQLAKAREADPTFLTNLPDDTKALLKDLQPYGALPQDDHGQPIGGGPINFVGELIYDSTNVAAVIRHFASHPEELTRLTTMPPELAQVPPERRIIAWKNYIYQEYYKLEGRLATGGEAPANRPPADLSAAPSTITAAPPPAPILTKPGSTTDPKAAALARGDFATFDRLDVQDRAAKRRPA